MKLSPSAVRALGLGLVPTLTLAGVLIASPVLAAPAPSPAPPAPLARIQADTPAPPADGIRVGSGSVAATPPPEVGQGVQDTLHQKLWIDKSLDGTPIPTNAWWTDLVISKYSGDLWANPLVVSNSSDGALVSSPRSWNKDGTTMQLGEGVRVGGRVAPQPDPSDTVLADFENGLPQGWTATGSAFAGTSTGTGKGQSAVSGWLGKGFLNSFTDADGDGATGEVRSGDFTIDRDALVAKIGGGNHPGKTELRVVVGDQTVASVTGDNSENLAWKTLDLTPWAGQTAHLEIVDELTAGWAHIMVDQIMLTNKTDGLDDRFGSAFKADDAVATGWGDWNVNWRLENAQGPAHINVSAARGVPYTWFQFDHVTPQLSVAKDAKFVDADGNDLSFPVTTDRFEIIQNGAKFGVHAPAKTTFDRVGDQILASEGVDHLAISAVPDNGFDLNTLQKYAFARVTGSKMTYVNNTQTGMIEQNWALTTEPLEGTGTDTIQGWLPHQYREADRFDPKLTGTTYATPRGEMRTSIGHDNWTMAYAFDGMTPVAGTPESLPDAPKGTDYSHDVMAKFLSDYAAKTTYGNDTYWGGKDLIQLGEYMLAAKQLGETDSYNKLKSTLRTAMTDWFTYTKGESSHFFARYDSWKALIGFSESYGSSQFTDNHFHYGYFTAAAAMLAIEDPEWAKGYGGVATLVAQQYGNWDRTSKDYPYLRTFDTWSGHSYAGGFSSPGGNNQESSSEAIQSWAGLYLLGVALGNTQMRDAGAMGYVTERASVREYWLNVGGALPASYKHSTTGILFDSGQAFATYFSGDPAWIYGIQWMPTAPWMNYLGWDRKAATKQLDDMFALRPDNLGGEGVRAGNKAGIQTFAKEWWGIGTYGDIKITEDRKSAIEVLKNIVRDSEKNNPGYTTRKVPENPLYYADTDSLIISIAKDGSVVFPDQYWTPDTLPASLIPTKYDGAMVDGDPANWSPASPLLPYFSVNYTPNLDVINALYGIKIDGYTPGRDTAAAARVISGMGDALGQVVLGEMAQSHPDIYADIFGELTRMKDPMISAVSMAGMVYYNAMANRGLGVETRDRRVGADFAQVYKNDAGEYSYVVNNITDQQQRYPVYQGAERIGWIDVPAHTQVTHHLDSHLAKITLSATPDATTITPGSTLALTATGTDQYGATVDIPNLEWSVDRGGKIGADGVFHADSKTDKATITATSGDITATRSVRVGDAPVLTSVAITPGPVRIAPNAPVTFTAAGVDQYGDPFALPGAVTWSTTATGAITADGVLTATAPGSGLVRASVTTAAGEVRGSTVVAVSDPSVNVALGATVSATSEDGPNLAKYAVDGDPGTRWDSLHGSDDQSITLDLGANYDLSGAHIVWEAAAAASYQIETATSEKGPFTPVLTVAKNNADPDSLTLNTTARYVRMHGLKRLGGYGYSIYEFQVFGTRSVDAITPTAQYLLPETATIASGARVPLSAFAYDATGAGGQVTDTLPTLSGPGSIERDKKGNPVYVAGDAGTATITLTRGGLTSTATITVAGQDAPTGPVTELSRNHPVTVSSTEDGPWDAKHAVDDDPGSRWSSGWSEGQWIVVDLGAVHTLDRAELVWERAFAQEFEIQTATTPDGPWTTVAHPTDGAEGGQKISLTGASGRYVKILSIKRGTGYGISLYDLKIFGNGPAS
ncbi:glycosyl hydrolase [Mycetocola saprophilus]|uniref:glycosyl hydrolase n=2 Tax=Actinomycetes TaxID=1760 RepID=UPI000AC5F153|nr:glycosyl hydrolase [Mycetocola saprophilus]